MEEMVHQYARLVGEVGLAGTACYALVRVWIQMITQSDQHRQDTAAQDKVHREEIKDLEKQHRDDLTTLNREHRAHVGEIVGRNMDEHRERNRGQVMMGMEVAQAAIAMGTAIPNPYPNIDEAGREDPRK